jgi:catechol 2,3-dioxygenase-like lactoylglutathione lyase family enzyme
MAKRHEVRYIVNDVDASIVFYTELLGFKVVMHPNSNFGIIVAE